VAATLERFAGQLIRPDDAQYDAARSVWNGMVDRRPAVIARCTDQDDVVAAVRHAREQRLPIAVRGGGHNVSGNAVGDGSLVVDLSGLREVEVDPVARRARVQPGVLLGELDRATQAFGLATPTGNVSLTGVAGLTLGGGLGWIARSHGAACDNLVAADVVTVDGDCVRASADERPDLLWGLRGGGGNFGVVTSFEFGLHRVGPEIVAGGIVHDFADAPEVLPFFARFAATAPDELSVVASTFPAPARMPVPERLRGALITVLAFCWIGDPAALGPVLAPLREFGRPLFEDIATMPYTTLQSRSDGAYPSGLQNYWKSHYVDDIGDEVVRALTEHAPGTGPMSSFYFQHLGGAIARADPASAAFGHRDATFDFTVLGVWPDPQESPEHIGWARALAGALEPHASGVYVNNLGVEGSDRVRAAYAPDRWEQLVALKRAYDPDNLLRFNQNVDPVRGADELDA
jgi:FAD/FMN-containing dehydrogenase